jgi:ubiquinone/menaquinone biosynthesis C-methylase UbiE
MMEIRDVPHFALSQYRDLDVKETIKFYLQRYVKQLRSYIDVKEHHTVADIGTGYGWLAIAFAMYTPAKIIAVDSDPERLEAANQIAEILGVEDRIEFVVGILGNLPFANRSIDITYCVEVLEHTQRSVPAAYDLQRITKQLIILTTPNLLCPVIGHDTSLPFCHWLPRELRQVYARAFDKLQSEHGNLFWSPTSLMRALPEFQVESNFLHYARYQDYLDTFPIYLPYNRGERRLKDGRLKTMYYLMASKLGRYSMFLLPSLACTLSRRA